MFAALWWIIVIGILAWLWLDSARAREMTVALVGKACSKHAVQFLDSTVALRRVGLRWTAQGVRIRRMFSFDFSQDGEQRHTGYIILLGTRLEQFTGFEPPDEDEPTNDADNTIVP